MITTHAATNDIVEALRAGVNSNIVKPFSVETFREKIDVVCDRNSASAGRCDSTNRRAIS
jgi:DNA-binding response OmpR family regulator